MTSFIVTSTDKIKRQEYIKKYASQLAIDPLDITTIQKDTAVKQNINTIGIEEVKNMQKKLFLKPIKSPTKAVILQDAHLLTTQAQNALLKVLEEPPDHTIIILSTQSKEPLLPTIISRCRIIELEHEKKKLPEAEIKELNEFIKNLPKMTISEKFKKAETLAKNKEQAIIWIEKIILVLREELLKQQSENYSSSELRQPANESRSSRQGRTIFYLQNLKSFQKTHTLLKTTNVNPRFLLENTLLHLH